MHKLYELKEALCDELENYAGRGLTRQNIPEIDTLAHACKNICKIIEFCEDSEIREPGGMSFRNGYSRRYPSGKVYDARMNSYGLEPGYSYRPMGNYSMHDQDKIDEIANDLRKIAEKLPDTYKGEIMRLSDKMHNLEE